MAQPTMYICWVQDKETNTSTLLAVHCRPTDNYQNSSSSSYSRMSHVCQPLQILPVFIITQQHNLMALHKDNIQCIPLTYSRHFLYYYHGLKTSRKWKIEKQDNTWHVKKSDDSGRNALSKILPYHNQKPIDTFKKVFNVPQTGSLCWQKLEMHQENIRIWPTSNIS